jgi:hypothetical protein
MSFVIPAEINSWDRLEAARFYHRELGWAVHALCPPNKGPDAERGKKPIAKGWRKHTAAEVSAEVFIRSFLNRLQLQPWRYRAWSLRCTWILIANPMAGSPCATWLEGKPELAAVPRERTGGGAHLSFICRDLPEAVSKNKKALTCQINDAVSAELYTDGMNLVLSPSMHKGGTRYQWEVTGENSRGALGTD